MKKTERRGSAAEILSLPNVPYMTAAGRGRSEAELKYLKRVQELFDAEKKRLGPNFRLKMRIKNGIPSFSAYRESPSNRALHRRITRTLLNIRKDVAGNKTKQRIISRIDRALDRAEHVLWEE